MAKGQSCGKSPGYGCTLVAESTNDNVRISAELMSNVKGEKQISAEEIGQQVAHCVQNFANGHYRGHHLGQEMHKSS